MSICAPASLNVEHLRTRFIPYKQRNTNGLKRVSYTISLVSTRLVLSVSIRELNLTHIPLTYTHTEAIVQSAYSLSTLQIYTVAHAAYKYPPTLLTKHRSGCATAWYENVVHLKIMVYTGFFRRRLQSEAGRLTRALGARDEVTSTVRLSGLSVLEYVIVPCHW